jgi:hypothetical protein
MMQIYVSYIVHVFGHGCLMAIMAWPMSERETWGFREELRDADRRDMGRDDCGSRSGGGSLCQGVLRPVVRLFAGKRDERKSFLAKPSIVKMEQKQPSMADMMRTATFPIWSVYQVRQRIRYNSPWLVNE